MVFRLSARGFNTLKSETHTLTLSSEVPGYPIVLPWKHPLADIASKAAEIGFFLFILLQAKGIDFLVSPKFGTEA